jgi:hypothetical protein
MVSKILVITLPTKSKIVLQSKLLHFRRIFRSSTYVIVCRLVPARCWWLSPASSLKTEMIAEDVAVGGSDQAVVGVKEQDEVIS